MMVLFQMSVMVPKVSKEDLSAKESQLEMNILKMMMEQFLAMILMRDLALRKVDIKGKVLVRI
jgi:hypothetical protein